MAGDEKPKPRAYASTDVEDRLGWIMDGLGQWAGMPVVLISREDLLPHLSEDLVSLFEKVMANPDYKLTAEEALTFREATLHAFKSHAAAVGNTSLLSYLDNPSEQMRLYTERLAGSAVFSAYRQTAAALTVNSRDYHMPENQGFRTCIITMPDKNMSAADFASFLSGGIPKSELKAVPGTGNDWLGFILAHEAGHCSSYNLLQALFGSPNLKLRSEARADQAAIDSYFNALTSGKPLSPDVPEYFAATRGLNFNFMPYHATGIFLNAAGGAHPREDTLSSLKNDPLSDKGFSVLLEIKAIVGKAKSRISADTGLDDNEALLAAYDNRPLLYETLKRMNHEGAFKDNPIQQAYVTHYLESAEKIAPVHFGIEKTQKPAPAGSQGGGPAPF